MARRSKEDVRMGYFDALMRYFEVWGRTSRSQYWTYQLIAFLLLVGAVFADSGAIRLGFEQGHLGIFFVFFTIFHFIPSITVTVRRLHDIGKSGFWYLLCFVPFGALVVLFWTIRRGDEGDNGYGDADGNRPIAPPPPSRTPGYEPPAGRVVRMGNTAPRPASSAGSGGDSTSRFI
jgi:uncharacterized membrane protein YhaH (DUF805 family)